MLDNKKIAAAEQAIAEVKETFPLMYWGLYRGYVTAGFTEVQAFDLIKTHIIANSEGPKKA